MAGALTEPSIGLPVPTLLRELGERYSGCPTGSAVITGAGKLTPAMSIHAVGPRWRDGRHGEPELLASAYRAAFTLAAEHACETVAAPSISTGIYGFPIEQAAPIAIEAAISALSAHETSLREITLRALLRRRSRGLREGPVTPP